MLTFDISYDNDIYAFEREKKAQQYYYHNLM